MPTLEQWMRGARPRIETDLAAAGIAAHGRPLPDASEIDPSAIPYGKSVLTKAGHVCSTAPDPASEAHQHQRRTA